MASPQTRTVSAVSVVNVFACAWFVHLVDHSQCRRAGVFIKARWAALGRPVELLARAEALLALEPELEVEEGLGLPCTPKKVAGRHWLGPSGEMDPKTRAAAAAAANALFIFLLSRPPGRQELSRSIKPYAHSQVVIRPCCDFF
ncbi:MAG: hypothetical protein QOE48_3467 [Mycobacterium sp.]|jgi:hypothetical protein|nr:hypothetical protein [Mycobacterium sp.]MDT5278466.1 hypothetical protein [Mycobacterium sp.]MDT5307789.1 hypothetical protein [Mycobacterium sp.]